MGTIFKAMMALSEDYVGTVEEASLEKRKPGKSYTHDSIQIKGVTEDGRKYCLTLTLEDKAE